MAVEDRIDTARPGLPGGLDVHEGARVCRRREKTHWFALAPSLIALGAFIYGFIVWTALISFSASRMLPDMTYVGLANYVKLWKLSIWQLATWNLVVFTFFYVLVAMALGLLMAILVDQRIRGEAFFRTLYLYPAALSFVVTGIVWKWLLNPGIGIENFLQLASFEGARFDWIMHQDTVIFAVVLAGVWQISGFAMALFLAGLRSVDGEMIKAARLDGAPTWRIYVSIILPTMKSTFVSVFVLLVAFAVKTYDLVVAMTAGGPGYASMMPTNFMYDMAFQRNQLGVSAASAIMILLFALVVVGPYLVSGFRHDER